MRSIARAIFVALCFSMVAPGLAARATGGRADASPTEPERIATIDGLFAALNSGDAAGAAAFYADNGVSGDAVGKAAILARLELGIAAGFQHKRISGQVFDDGHVDVVDEVHGPLHAFVVRTYEFDSAGKIVFSKELRSVVLNDEPGAPAQGTVTAPNTGTGPGRANSEVGWRLAALLAVGVCIAAAGVAVGARTRPAPTR